jgi:type I restriction enzyme M protein
MHIVLGILTLKYLSDKHDLAIERIKEKGLEVDDLDDAELFDEFETFRLNDKSN